MLSYAFIYIPWFTRLQENINKPYHVMHTALDDMIPFEEIFIVPYLMWFLYVAATLAFFFFFLFLIATSVVFSSEPCLTKAYLFLIL